MQPVCKCTAQPSARIATRDATRVMETWYDQLALAVTTSPGFGMPECWPRRTASTVGLCTQSGASASESGKNRRGRRDAAQGSHKFIWHSNAMKTCPLQCVSEALQTCANLGEITVDPPLRLNSNVMTTSNPLWHFYDSRCKHYQAPTQVEDFSSGLRCCCCAACAQRVSVLVFQHASLESFLFRGTSAL